MPEFSPQPEIKSEFELRREAFAERINIKSQWESQVKALNEAGILETLPESHSFGIVGIDGKEYQLPKYQEIISNIDEEQLNILEQKNEQGFSKMLLVPFAMPLDILIDRFKRLILKHHQESKLLSTDGTKLDLDTNDPFNVWDQLKQADQKPRIDKDALFYYPQNFDKDPNIHQGKTKQEILDSQEHLNIKTQEQDDKITIKQKDKEYNFLTSPGWQIMLVEDLPDLPAEGKGKIQGGRKQLEANQSAEQYLESIQTKKEYKHESGCIPESEITYAITQLIQTNQMIDNYSGKGKACRLFGSCISGDVPYFFWGRDVRRAILDGGDSGTRYEDDGSRSAVIY